ncbi:MAG: hypothetical protein Q8J63_08985 [Candidatus Aquicultor sp.]|nr:hypothetical protein [Candidatus Aquicultor sp.]
MIRSLRKGTTTLELNHRLGTDCVNAIETEVELQSGKAVVRTKLKPVDSNQADDADCLIVEQRYDLETVAIVDSRVRERLGKFLRAYADQITEVKLEINYRKIHSYPVTVEAFENDGLLFNLK